MDESRKTLLWCAVASGAAVLAISFLLPRGEVVSFELLRLGALLGLLKLGSMLYAMYQPAQEVVRAEALLPAVEWHDAGKEVPESLMETGPALIALRKEGEVPHPEFVSLMAPYFADPTLGFVQGATRFVGEGPAAEVVQSLSWAEDQAHEGRGTLRAVGLRRGAAIVAREALRAAWQPAISWEALGARMQAMGFRARFEPVELVLERAPQTLEGFSKRLLGDALHAAKLLPLALVRGLPFEARVQYAADAAGYGAALCTGASLVLAPFAFFVRGSGPIILGHSFLPLYAIFGVFAFAALRLMGRATGGALNIRVLTYAVVAVPMWGALELGRYIRKISMQALERIRRPRVPAVPA